MRRIILLSIGIVFSLCLWMCESEEGEENTTDKIKWVKTEPGACNTDDWDRFEKDLNLKDDTLIFTIYGDTLKMHLGINYICCAPFTSTAAFSEDTLLVTVSDTCTVNCHCRCMCYYTWDFHFVDFETKEYPFKVILNDPRAEDPIIFRQGVVDLSGK